MRLRGAALLASNLLKAGARTALDDLRASSASSLPTTPEALARVEVVEALLREARPPGAPPPPRVAAVRLPGVDFESSNCRNFLIELEAAAAGDGGIAQAPLPRTLYAKLPTRAFATRVFAGALGFWDLECTFCERVAPQVPIRVPRVFAVARDGARFVLLLENLRESPGVELFLNRDMAAGTTPERARLCLSAFAELHAHFHGWPERQREALLPHALHPNYQPRAAAMNRALNAAAIAPALRAAPELFPPDVAALCRRALARYEAMRAYWCREPLTLVHGDSHLANFFQYASPTGPRMGMLDFQAVHWSKGIRDVQYFLIHSLEPDVLAAHEDDLIDHYLAEVARFGVVLDREETREQYRAFSFQTLMVGVVAVGLGGLTEREETVRTVLRREVAAIRRLRFGDWLDGLS
jgi:hypothetical protein